MAALGKQCPQFAASVGFWVRGIISVAVQLGLARFEVLCQSLRMTRRLAISLRGGHNKLLVATTQTLSRLCSRGTYAAVAPQQRRWAV
ncbi:hypothetical protein [Povalibacter sp.]|uniref:hypothetical protein n=1 Tax=Povalibacter sp. TaxID=1962978 RepID=UPI002F410789